MKYYVYISDSKIEMLYEQIPWTLRKQLSFNLGFDFGIIKGNFSNTDNSVARNKKLQMIINHLEKETGTIHSPDKYFYGEMEMLWGQYEKYDNFVYFGGKGQNVEVGLGGTLTNCIGISEKQEKTTSYSYSPYLISALAKKGEILDPHKGFTRERRVKELNNYAMKAVAHSNMCLNLPKQKLEFFAKKIIHGQVDERGTKTVLIGSPLYVALAE